MKVIVTGAAGFIGSNLTDYLLNKGYEIIAIDNFCDFYDPKIKEFNISEFKDNKKFELHRIDITDRKKLESILKKHSDAQAIVHLAAWAGVTQSVEHPDIFISANVDGTNNLAEFAVKHGVKNFIFASTSSVYGDNKTPFKEDMNTDFPNAPYPATKKACEVLLYTYKVNFDLKVTIFRFFNPLGYRVRPDLALPKLIRSALYGYVFKVYQDPKNSARDYTYILHMNEAIEYAIKKPFDYEVMNLGNSQPVSLWDLMQVVESVTGGKIKMTDHPLPGQMKETYANIDRAQKLVNYDPSTTLEEMVNIFHDWFIKQPEWYRMYGVKG